jgi:hypothetical protein
MPPVNRAALTCSANEWLRLINASSDRYPQIYPQPDFEAWTEATAASRKT